MGSDIRGWKLLSGAVLAGFAGLMFSIAAVTGHDGSVVMLVSIVMGLIGIRMMAIAWFGPALSTVKTIKERHLW